MPIFNCKKKCKKYNPVDAFLCNNYVALIEDFLPTGGTLQDIDTAYKIK